MKKLSILVLLFTSLIISCSESNNNITEVDSIHSSVSKVIIDKDIQIKTKSSNLVTLVEFYHGPNCFGEPHNFKINVDNLDEGQHTYQFLADAQDNNPIYDYFVSGKYITGTYYINGHKIEIQYLGDSERIFKCSNDPYGNPYWKKSVNNKKVFSFCHPNDTTLFPRYIYG